MKNKQFSVLAIILLFFTGLSHAQITSVKGSRNFAADSSSSWKQSSVKSWMKHYQYEGFYRPFNSGQVVNVLEIDLNNPEAHIAFVDSRPSDSLSSVVKRVPNSLAAINGTYYEILANERAPGGSISSSFFKSDNQIKTEVTVPENHQLFWKHEGAFYYEPTGRKSGIIYGDSKLYKDLVYPNVVSGSPMLIFNYKPVGENFVKKRNVPVDSLNYEDPDRHQAVRHPRTAIARTENNHILLITVDGRAEKAAGMSAKELTQFIRQWFNPKDALNLDGGGSTTMWIKDNTVSTTGVVNYPTDDKKFDHYGQRKIRNSLVVTSNSK